MNTSLLFRFLILFNLMSICVQAQKLRMGFLAGPTFNLAAYDFSSKNEPNPNLISNWESAAGIGFFAGFAAEHDFTDKLFLSAGLTFNNVSFKATNTDEYPMQKLTQENRYQFSVFGLQLPVLLQYRISKFNVGIGGFAALAIAGTLKYKQFENQSLENSYSQDLVFNDNGEQAADFRPFNAGLRAEVGFGVKRWRVTSHFDLGLLNLSSESPSADFEVQKYPLKRSSLGFSFLYQPWPR